MKKIITFVSSAITVILCVTGCDFVDEIDKTIENSTKPNVSCTLSKQYRDKSGYSYYVEGKCLNEGSKDYDYLQVEYICYDKEGNNVGTALANTNNLLSSQSWKFKAMYLGNDAKSIKKCEFHEVTGW